MTAQQYANKGDGMSVECNSEVTSGSETCVGDRLAVVVIGRNEGPRLRDCIQAILAWTDCVVYVDSDSTDDSVDIATSLGIEVVRLDLSVPFTAARARNEGFRFLRARHPERKYVQFVDGDCELTRGWLARAFRELEGDSRIGLVCGRTRERHPDASIYNRLRDMEGEVEELGGIFMIRTDAFKTLGGFREFIIAAEDTELGIRMRTAGWEVVRLDADMAWHDAAMHHWRQWWKRTVRSGHAHAEVSKLHGAAPQRSRMRLALSSWFWGMILPAIILITAWPSHGMSLLLLVSYLLLYVRIARKKELRCWRVSDRRLFAIFCILGKLPEAIGQVMYWYNRILGRTSTIIEYQTGGITATS